MIQLTASTFIGNGSLWLYVDNELIARNSDSISFELQENKEYILHWFVSGSEGARYSISISSPREAEYQVTRRLPEAGKDIGSILFGT